jgi:hypothetical protein
MQTSQIVQPLPVRPNVVELAALLEDTQLESLQRRSLQLALRENLCRTRHTPRRSGRRISRPSHGANAWAEVA